MASKPPMGQGHSASSPIPKHRYVASKALHTAVKQAKTAAGSEREWNATSVRGIVDDNVAMVHARNLPTPPAAAFPLEASPENPATLVPERDAADAEEPQQPSATTEERQQPLSSTTEFACVNIDTVTAGLALSRISAADANDQRGCRPRSVAVLSFANAEVPGGRYVSGGRAQEEDLCRLIPQLHPTLVASKAYPLPLTTTLVSPALGVLRRPGSYARVAKDEPALGQLSVLTAAMPCGAADRRPPGGWLKSAWAEDVSLRIRSVLRAAIATGHEDIVLGAFGCGAFGNPPGPVATLFAQELRRPEVRGCFRRVVFAVLDPVGTGNFKPFSEGIAKLAD